jgi:hypothetical protein
MLHNEEYFRRMLKRPFSKAAASEEEAYARYVEPPSDARTPLADFSASR